MTAGVLSPYQGILSDDDEIAHVLESTAADFGNGVCKALLTDFSVISPGEGAKQIIVDQNQTVLDDGSEKVKVYLRVRPFGEMELSKGENQGCVNIVSTDTLFLKAPKDSFTMKNLERGIGQATHKFSFTQIFGPDTTQKEFFNATVKEIVKEVLEGQNRLIYTYGVTNSGKTFTIQGTVRDGGILPRSLAVIFNSIRGKLYSNNDLKLSCSEVVWLDSKQARLEEAKKMALLTGLREDDFQTPLKSNVSGNINGNGDTNCSFDSGFAGLSSCSHLEDSSSHCSESMMAVSECETSVQYCIWVSFFEIYNEFIYDLLETVPFGQTRKRHTLRLSEDRNGNPYVKDLTWINICDAEEAWKVLKVGRKNQSIASTHLNQNSSRSHSIFSIRILHITGGKDLLRVLKMSELSLCDLAGSERCKDQKCGDRMKEASNINTSLHTLGRCISALRQNQQQKVKPNVVPFRDSKLTRVFQGYFCGRGKSCMIVNINQCASTYDETLHVMKFSALASQLVQAPPMKLRLQSIIREHSMRGNQSLDEEVLEEESEDEADVSMFDRETLNSAVEALKELLVKERQERITLEYRVREEVCNEMMEEMQNREKQFSERLEAEKDILEDKYERKLENLKEYLTKYYQQEIQERDEKIELLEVAMPEFETEKISRTRKYISIASIDSAFRRSERLAGSQLELKQMKENMQQAKDDAANYKKELEKVTQELKRLQNLVEPCPSTKSFTVDVDRKLQEGQKHIRILRSELQQLGELLQSAERACCHSTSAEKLRQTLNNCDDILVKQYQTLSELQNNMTLVKIDLKKKTACIAEQYQTVNRLQNNPSSCKKRACANMENVAPVHLPEKRPFLRSFLSRTPTHEPLATGTPSTRILRTQKSPSSLRIFRSRPKF